ncbi:hypothetical protein [Arthrobacter cryoconiti]|uniref:Uncharacterized protein n=1 Tax=Arthrobacter cryoconiti TaxID=748907 RepID=A0ABV8QY13_9MICC|nr:hypothetical protein [Arthrobacter cryoconiti]MCC9068787.1 hypothetical protein [Arthrobacter cryoconiti]
MESASAFTGILAQLGFAGLTLIGIIAGLGWYLKTSKDLREEKRGVIASLELKIKDREAEIEKLMSRNTDLTRALLDCQFPGRLDPE